MEGRHKLSEFMIASYINKKFTRSIKYWIYLEVKYPTLFTEFSLVSLTYMYEKLFRLAAEVRFCLDSDYKVSSLNIPLNSDDGSEIQDLIVDNSEELQDIPINPQLKPELIAALRKYLTDKQYYIVIKYFGIGGDSVSMRTIAKRLDISTGEVEGEMQIAMSVLRNKASNLLRFLSEDT
jgi:DNA-directed RNA polymerase sigma subunit (sigma70/sigma32)